MDCAGPRIPRHGAAFIPGAGPNSPAIGNDDLAPHRSSNWTDAVLDYPAENLVQLAVGSEPRVRRDLGTVEFQLQAIVEIDSECLPVLRLAFRV